MSDQAKVVLGIDIGGSGIKGGLVDLATGTLVTHRYRLDTPDKSTPEAVAETVADVAAQFDHQGPCGITFPGVVKGGQTMTAANLDKSWVGVSLTDIIGSRLAGPVVFVNDADAAGLAEVTYGVGQGQRGLVMMVTFGTGIGTALIHDGRLIPNSELGHIEIDGHDAESRAAASARKREDLSWEDWADRASIYLRTVERLIWPDMFIVGGGISKRREHWLSHIDCNTRVVVAELLNDAGIVGAALVSQASEQP